MARPEASEQDKMIETWEITFGGSVWVWTYNRREDRYIKVRIGGRTGSKRVHISRDDRKFNQEQVPDENSDLDPFTNGALRLVDAASRDESLDTRYHLTQEDLAALLEVRDADLFATEIKGISSELVLRRLMQIAETKGTVAQVEGLRELLSERYPVGGTQKTVREMIEAGERIGAQRI